MDRPVALDTAPVQVPPAEGPVRPRDRAAARRLRWPAAVAAGLLLLASFPPYDLWVLAPLGAAALTLAVHGARLRTAAVLGLVCGLVLFVPLLRWSGLEVGPLPWLLLAVSQAAFFAPLGALLSLVQRLPGWPVWVAAAWVAQEAARSRLPFGGFTWGRLGFGQVDSPLAALASYGGVPLVGAGVALAGAALALVAVRRDARSVAVAAGLAGVLALPVLLWSPGTGGEQVRVAVVQGGVPRLGLDFNAQRAAVLGNHVEATRQLAAAVRAGEQDQPDLVVWPENASDIDPFEDPQAYAAIERAVRDIGVPVLVGAVLDGPGEKISNTGIVWDPVTGPGERYVKRHPVPFGEYIPLRSFARLISDKVDLVARDFAAGEEVGVLDVGPARVGDVICFEVAYDDLVRDVVQEGGRLVVVQTNNATFGRSPQTEQQLAMSRLRAVEHDRAVVVAATSGVSAVVRPDGSLAHRTDVFTRDVTVQAVPLRDRRTLATRLGAAPEAAIVLAALASAGVALRRGRAAA